MKYIFGPVPSRRLGRSLGIDIIPFKTCSYDCVYCQLGRTSTKTITPDNYFSIEDILAEFKELNESGLQVDYITFSGSGEPTLHSGIGKLIKGVKKITSVPVAVLTNGSLLYDPKIREQLYYCDLVVPSLDAASESVFKQINRPHMELSFFDVIEGLESFTEEFNGNIWLEFLAVKDLNDGDTEIEHFAEIIKKFKIDTVHINTVNRPPAEPGILPVSSPDKITKTLFSILDSEIEIIGDYSEIGTKKTHTEEIDTTQARKYIIDAIKRRPLTIDDMSNSLGYHPQEIIKYINTFSNEGLIEPIYHAGIVYYHATSKIR